MIPRRSARSRRSSGATTDTSRVAGQVSGRSGSWPVYVRSPLAASLKHRAFRALPAQSAAAAASALTTDDPAVTASAPASIQALGPASDLRGFRWDSPVAFVVW